jgi:hypothetical protein
VQPLPHTFLYQGQLPVLLPACPLPEKSATKNRLSPAAQPIFLKKAYDYDDYLVKSWIH